MPKKITENVVKTLLRRKQKKKLNETKKIKSQKKRCKKNFCTLCARRIAKAKGKTFSSSFFRLWHVREPGLPPSKRLPNARIFAYIKRR